MLAFPCQILKNTFPPTSLPNPSSQNPVRCTRPFKESLELTVSLTRAGTGRDGRADRRAPRPVLQARAAAPGDHPPSSATTGPGAI